MHKFDLSSPKAIEKLSNEEIMAVLESVEAVEQEALLKVLEEHNKELEAKIESNQREIESERATNQILLKRLWRGLSADAKKSSAAFFKSLSNEINEL
ncbi:hypothetical protein ENBRE01_0746 [Enteropsectra breve]|nr:hypothetical protein ENBRE01_0746 [Enteropsectra breve]